MAFINPAEWQMYMDTIYEAWDTFGTEPVIWRRMVNNLDYHGEDTPGSTGALDINIIGLIQYNYFRTWPLTAFTPSGEVDQENSVLILSRKYLSDNGWLTADGNFDFRPGEDRFVIRDLIYKPAGDTQVSGAFQHPLLVFIILKREEIPTGSKVY